MQSSGSAFSGAIAIHIGAGFHSESKRNNYEALCKKACKMGVELLKKGCSAIDIVTHVISVLEDSPLTNAGVGSNLTEIGSVECDASIMDGKFLNHGAVGAITNIKNPIQVAKEILLLQNQGSLSLGRIPPCLLVNKGAEMWAKNHGFSLSDNLISGTAKDAFKKYKRKLKHHEESSKIQNSKTSTNEQDDNLESTSFTSDKEIRLDTVGAVCIDSNFNMVSGASSGGVALKHPGRVGQAAVYGCGCWAQNSSSLHPSVATCTSGGGEYLIKTIFAKQCADSLMTNENSMAAVLDAFENKFLKSPFLSDVKEKYAGLLALTHFPDEKACELLWAHTTATMFISYASCANIKPKMVFSHLPSSVRPGEKTVVGSARILLHK